MTDWKTWPKCGFFNVGILFVCLFVFWLLLFCFFFVVVVVVAFVFGFFVLFVCLFVFVLFCFVLFCFVLFCFVLFCFVLFCFVLFCFVLFFPLSERQMCLISVGHSFVQCEIWNLIFGWTKYKTEHRVEEVCCSKCFIVSVISFNSYFTSKFIKTGKKLSKQKKWQAWILLNQARTEKQMRAAALRHRIYLFIYLFFSLKVWT